MTGAGCGGAVEATTKARKSKKLQKSAVEGGYMSSRPATRCVVFKKFAW